MPFARLSDLPKRVKDVLPPHAEEIFLAAFNNAWDEYGDPSKRDDPKEPREIVAFQVAWAAVKRNYEKDKTTGEWVAKGR